MIETTENWEVLAKSLEGQRPAPADQRAARPCEACGGKCRRNHEHEELLAKAKP